MAILSKPKIPSYYRLWFFNNLAYVYDLAVNILLSGKQAFYWSKISMAIPKKAESVADFGCGTGTLLSYIAKNNQPVGLIGVDLSPRMLQKAKNKLPKEVKLYRENIERTQFDEASFDCLILSWVLHELPIKNLKKALKEAVRVLKKNGQLIIFDFHRSKPTPLLRLQHFLGEKYMDDFYHFDLPGYLHLLNFKKIDQRLLWDNHLQILTA